MVRPLSMDLRSRLLAAVDSGLSCRAAAARFGVAPSTVIRWQAQRRETGALCLPGRVTDRTFLGERWDYGLILDSGLSLRAAGPPEEDFPEGAHVWVSFRETAVIPIENETADEAAT